MRFFEVSEAELQTQRELFRTGRLQIKIEDIDFSMKCARPSAPRPLWTINTLCTINKCGAPTPCQQAPLGLLRMLCCLWMPDREGSSLVVGRTSTGTVKGCGRA